MSDFVAFPPSSSHARPPQGRPELVAPIHSEPAPGDAPRAPSPPPLAAPRPKSERPPSVSAAEPLRVLVLDNYDSFTFNLVQYVGELGATVEVHKNDGIDIAGIVASAPDGILISPGPCTPNEAGISLQVLRELGSSVPVFGVCLGHQAIGQAYGGRVVRAARLMHGKTSPILHEKRGVFEGLPSPFSATRYHSLLVERASLPDCLEITAWTEEGEIMGLRHREHAVEGVQFHPESVLTREGKHLVQNWLDRLARRRDRSRS